MCCVHGCIARHEALNVVTATRRAIRTFIASPSTTATPDLRDFREFCLLIVSELPWNHKQQCYATAAVDHPSVTNAARKSASALHNRCPRKTLDDQVSPLWRGVAPMCAISAIFSRPFPSGRAWSRVNVVAFARICRSQSSMPRSADAYKVLHARYEFCTIPLILSSHRNEVRYSRQHCVVCCRSLRACHRLRCLGTCMQQIIVRCT